MSLVTTCPQCQTAFVVKPEHLAAHRGDVRCGKCDHSFNALEYLSEPADSVSEPVEHSSPPSPDEANETQESLHEPEVTSDSPFPAGDTPLESHDHRDNQVGEDYEPLSSPTENESEETSDPTQLSGSDVDDEVSEPDIHVEPSDEVESEGWVPEEYPSPPVPVLQEDEAPADSSDAASVEIPDETVVVASEPVVLPEPEPKMIRMETPSAQQAFLSTPSPKPRRVKTWVWLLFTLLLVLAIVLQTAYFLRTEISINVPQSKPLLTQMCHWIGCTIDLPRKIEMISIDDSDLQEDNEHEGVVLLTATLINHAHFAQAYPLLELTLTDTDDRPVLRRSITPQEYLPTGSTPSSGMAADGEVHIRLTLKTNDIKAAGYRVFITY